MPAQSGTSFLLYLLVPVAIFYFLLLRPQQTQQKKRRQMLDALNSGDKVVTIGGIHGTVTEMDEKTASLRIAENVEIKVNRSAIGTVLKSEE